MIECEVCGRSMPTASLGEMCGFCRRGAVERIGTLPLLCLEEFHSAFGVPIRRRPEVIPEGEVMLRSKLIRQEATEALEVLDVMPQGPEVGTPAEEWEVAILAALGLELADILYVTYGTAVQFGIPLDRIFAAVHASQFTKLGPDGEPVYDEDGKVLKGPGYAKPDVAAIVREARS